MLTYNNILVPTDFSPNATVAVSQAVALARESKGCVHLFHVVEMALFGPAYIPQGGFVYPRDKTEIYERLDAIKAQYPDVTFETKAVIGSPAEEIVAYAESHDIDLICISTTGRRGLSRALLGSTTEAVVRRARCPVLSMHGARAHVEEAASGEQPASVEREAEARAEPRTGD